MRLLITGWHGQVAQALIEVAPRRADIEACAVGRPALDICEVKTIERALGDIKPDVVINTAAYTDVDKAEQEPERAMALNCEGARLLAKAAAERGTPILHLSTDYVYAGTANAPHVETDPTNPATVYGQTKLKGEAAVQAANPKHVILRTAWVFSPFGRNFIKTILKKAHDGVALRVVADQFGSPTYAPHLVDVILEIAARIAQTDAATEFPWGIYHAAGSGRASWFDVARKALLCADDVKHLADKIEPIGSAQYATTTPRPAHSELNCTKLEKTFGIKLPDWQDGVAECVARLSEGQQQS